MTVFWDLVPCSLIEIDWHFRGTYHPHHQGDVITLIMEAVGTSETPINFYKTIKCKIPENK
jgi:hypothetical protein